MINNTTAIQKRGGGVYGDDDFEIVQCVNCGCQYLYNAEVLQLYYDPEDLSKVYLNSEGSLIPPCRKCGIKDWNFSELKPDDAEKVKSGSWSWLLVS